jgi:hypothetical protein
MPVVGCERYVKVAEVSKIYRNGTLEAIEAVSTGARIQGEGDRSLDNGWRRFNREAAPHPGPLPANGAREVPAARGPAAALHFAAGVIIGEFISAQAGLGFYILYVSSRMETALVFAALLVLCVIGVALFGAVALAEQLVRRGYGRR